MRLERQRMDGAFEFRRQRCVNHAVALNPALPFERIGRPVTAMLSGELNPAPRARLSHKVENAATAACHLPDATDLRIGPFGSGQLRVNHRPVVSPGELALIASACTDPLSSASSAVLTMR